MISKTILNNGIRVVSENIPHSYSVSLGIWVANGSRHERRELNGIAHFIEHLLFKGTTRRSALEIAREIDAVGGILNAFTGREYVCYYVKVLDKFLPKAVDLLADIFLNSTLDPEEIEKERDVILQEIGQLEDTPDDYIHDLFTKHFWHGHPLGMPILGNRESVAGLTREKLLAYKEKHYRADDIIIAAAGKVDHEDLLSLISHLFREVPQGRNDVAAPIPHHVQRLEIVEKDLEQVHLCLGTLALSQSHAQRYEAYLLNAILGGSMSSRLFQEVREKLGLVYSIYTYLASHTDTGALTIYAGTAPEHATDVIEVVLREIRRIKNEPISKDELSAAKEQLKGNILLSLESSDNRMSKLAKNEIYFSAYQPLDEIMASIDRVTTDSLLELCGQLFDERFLTLVLMGKVVDKHITPSLLKI
jgi:predicted Zn-dependent peptidase